jgi:hypothetical protein
MKLESSLVGENGAGVTFPATKVGHVMQKLYFHHL